MLSPVISKKTNGDYDITVANLKGTGNAPRSADITIKVKPVVGKQQRVVLLLNEFNPNPVQQNPGQPLALPPQAQAYTFDAPSRNKKGLPDTTDTLTIPIQGVNPGTYLLRLQVDGAESLLDLDSDKNSPTFNLLYINPKVPI
jgi:hypothetical protein